MFTLLKRLLVIIVAVSILTTGYNMCVTSRDITGRNMFGRVHFRTEAVLEQIGRGHEVDKAIDFVLQNSFSDFKKSMNYESMEVLVKPLSEKYGNVRILWSQEQNDELRIILYQNEQGVICDHQMNVRMLAFIIFSEESPFSYEQIMNDADILQRVKKNARYVTETKMIDHVKCNLLRSDGTIDPGQFIGGSSVELAKIIQDCKNFHLTQRDFIRLHSVAQVHFSFIELFLHKLKALQADPEHEVQFVPSEQITYTYSLYKKDPRHWVLAYSLYYSEHYYARIFFQSAFQTLSLLFVLLPLPFLIIQFLRKSLNAVIAEEFAPHGVTPRRKMLYQIYLMHWTFLFYQPEDDIVSKRIHILVKRICDKEHHQKLIAKARELYLLFSGVQLSKNVLATLDGSYKVSVQEDASFGQRYAALNTLQGHLKYLRPVSTSHTPSPSVLQGPISSKPKRQKAEKSDRDILAEQIASVTGWVLSDLKKYSMPQLYHFDLLVDVALKMGNGIFDVVMQKDPGELIQKQFIEAVRLEDKPLIKKYLGIQDAVPSVEVALPQDISKLLAGKSAVLLTGHRGYRTSSCLLSVLESMGAIEPEYIYAKIPYSTLISTLQSPLAQEKLYIAALPFDHAVLRLLRSYQVSIHVIDSCSPESFQDKLVQKLISKH